MKTNRIKISITGLAILFVSISFRGYASPEAELDLNGSGYFEQYFTYEAFDKMLDQQLYSDVKIRIYDMTDNLIACGNENEDKIKRIITKADLLTEINGIKYYRLSYR